MAGYRKPGIFIKALLLIFCLIIPAKHAHADDLSFTRYSSSDGLSQNTITVSFQDSRGFMWFGTQDGLNRFDGTEFRVYRHDPNDSSSLSENWIWTIYEDKSGFIWVGTFGGGACRYDPVFERFTTFRHNPANPSSISNNTVWSFHESPEGILWIGANDGLNKFDSGTGEFRYFKPPFEPPNIFRILRASDGFLWLRTGDGPLRFDMTTEEYEPKVNDLYEGAVVTSSGDIWTTQSPEKLARYSRSNESVTYYSVNRNNPVNLPPFNQISSALEDRSGAVWFGTRRDGLVILTTEGNAVSSHRAIVHDPHNQHSLSHNSISSLYEKAHGHVWVGTREGLNSYDPGRRKFRLLRALPEQKTGLSHNIVLPIVESARTGKVWIGTYDGLTSYDPGAGVFEVFRQDSRNPQWGPGGNHILSLLEDKTGNLWIGTRANGLSRMTPDKRFTHYSIKAEKGEALPGNSAQSLYQDRAGVVWVGTGGNRLHIMDEATGTLRRVHTVPSRDQDRMDLFIFAIFEDKAGRFWVGTSNGGLCLVERETGTFIQYANDPLNPHSLSSNRVLCMTETRGGDIWIGTASGLNKLIEGDEPSFKAYREKDGLPSSVIYGILEDDAGRLWISTNKGLARIDPTEDSLNVRSYSHEDGVQGDEFNQNAFHRGSSGLFYFGGTNGLNMFDPDSVRDNPHIPPVVFTDFKILNETVRVGVNEGNTSGGNSFTLDRSITHTEEIVLSYRENVFSLEFAALDYSVPDKNQYAYRMVGFDKDWIFCGTRRFATYTNLDPGEYEFRVKGSNNDGVWNDTGASVRIVITPPPWKSWWAYGIYGLASGAALVAFVRARVRANEREIQARADIERAKVEERERMRRKSSADFHDEAGHLLTKITLFLELARRKTNTGSEIHDFLAKIEDHTKALSSGMRDFIWGLDPEKDSLSDTLVRIKDFGNQMFQYSTTIFETGGMNSIPEDISLPMEVRRSIVFIFKEAMTNCLKYSRASRVSFKSEVAGDELILRLSDDGVGFSIGNGSDGYGLKNMQARAGKIGGTLAIRSGGGTGTEIEFRIPLPGVVQDTSGDNTANG